MVTLVKNLMTEVALLPTRMSLSFPPTTEWACSVCSLMAIPIKRDCLLGPHAPLSMAFLLIPILGNDIAALSFASFLL